MILAKIFARLLDKGQAVVTGFDRLVRPDNLKNLGRTQKVFSRRLKHGLWSGEACVIARPGPELCVLV